MEETILKYNTNSNTNTNTIKYTNTNTNTNTNTYRKEGITLIKCKVTCPLN